MTSITAHPESLKYPLGKFVPPQSIDSADIERWIQSIENLPKQMRNAVEHLSIEQLDTPYRDGGWTIRQVVHHVPDSHMNGYIRFKLALTEDQPAIRPYIESLWAELYDSKRAPIELSLNLLELTHQRWVIVLRHMNPADFAKTFFHPESKLTWRLDASLAHYEWHGRHHLAHITEVKKRQGWK